MNANHLISFLLHSNSNLVESILSKKTCCRGVDIFYEYPQLHFSLRQNIQSSLLICLTTSIKFRGVMSALIRYPSTRLITDLREASSCSKLVIIKILLFGTKSTLLFLSASKIWSPRCSGSIKSKIIKSKFWLRAATSPSFPSTTHVTS